MTFPMIPGTARKVEGKTNQRKLLLSSSLKNVGSIFQYQKFEWKIIPLVDVKSIFQRILGSH